MNQVDDADDKLAEQLWRLNPIPDALSKVMTQKKFVATIEQIHECESVRYCDTDYTPYLERHSWSLRMAFSLLAIAQLEGCEFESQQTAEYAEMQKNIEICTEFSKFYNIDPIKCSAECDTRNIVPRDYLRWARSEGYTLPRLLLDFIGPYGELSDYEKDAISLKKAQRNSQVAKIKTQAVAETLWYLNPTWTAEQIINHHAVQEFGEGKRYAGRNTLRDWVREVDPRPPESKIGRPKNTKGQPADE